LAEGFVMLCRMEEGSGVEENQVWSFHEGNGVSVGSRLNHRICVRMRTP